MKKLLAMLLLLAMLGTMLASCNKDKDPSKTGEITAAATGDAADDYLPAPKAEYEGREYGIIFREDYAYEWEYDEADAGSHINDAIYKRNQAVENRYQVALTYYPVVSTGNGVFEANFMDPITTTVLNGENVYQMAAGYEYRLAYNSALGNFLDWYKINNVDLSADWWDGDFAEAASYKDHTYIMTGSLSLSHLYSSSCVFFNEDMINSTVAGGASEVFATVEDGTWTLETFYNYVKEFTADDDGVEGMSENDTYGYATNDTTAVDAFLFCSNIPVSGRNSDGEIKLYSMSEKLTNLASKLNEIINTSGNTYNQSSTQVDMNVHIGMISKGKTAFTTSALRYAVDLRETTVNYGILPYPKYDESQKNYYSITMDYSTAFAIPKTAEQDIDFVGTITEAMAYYSYQYVRDALYNTVLKYRDAKDAESSKSVDIILANPKYDFAYIYAFSWGDEQGPTAALRNCIGAGSADIAGYFEQFKTKYNTKLADFLVNFQ